MHIQDAYARICLQLFRNFKTNISRAPVNNDNGKYIVATASLTIDRTKWGITYKSGSVLGLVKDELLDDKKPVSLALRFHQQQ